MSAVRELLAGAIDYAGLFPPAGLDLEKTVRNYAAYRKGPDRWALGKLIVPAARLPGFEKAAASLLDPEDPWPISALGGNDLAADLKSISSFERRDARVVSLEIKAGSVAEIQKSAALVKGGPETFYEIPTAKDPRELLDAIHAAGGHAKVRTGGTVKGAAPSPAELARFLDLAQARVSFKATAGLHHAVRAVRPLTYEAGCDRDVQHGFLNVFVAACLAPLAEDANVLREVLEIEDARRFTFDAAFAGGTGVEANGHAVALDEIRYGREHAILSFGSCSFDEPIAELKELKLL